MVVYKLYTDDRKYLLQADWIHLSSCSRVVNGAGGGGETVVPVDGIIFNFDRYQFITFNDTVLYRYDVRVS